MVARFGLRVGLVKPRGELRFEIGAIAEDASLEERILHPLHDGLDGALLVAAARGAHLDTATHLEDRVRTTVLGRSNTASNGTPPNA